MTLALCVLVGDAVLLHPQRGVVGANPASDFQIMTWSLAWWPWSVGHGADPFTTQLLWAPVGFPTTWITAIPAVAVLALPLTLGLGPLFAYNAMMFAAVALAGGCAYLLCRELTGRTVPAMVGGVLFGLSPYMLGHTLSQHLDLTFVWPVPLLAWATVRRLRGRWRSCRSFVLVVAFLLVVELGSSLELFVDLTLALVLAFAIALVGAGTMRAAVVRTAGALAIAYGVALPFIGAIAYLALSVPHGALAYPPADYSTDLANLVVPTPLALLGAVHGIGTVSRHFVGNIGEQDGYLGIPALAVAGLGARSRWRGGGGLAAALLVVLVALSLGPVLTVRGRPAIGIPFSTARLPLVAGLLPARLSLFAMLLTACLVAVWLSLEGRVWLRLAVGAVVVASLLPNFALSGRVPGAWARSDVVRFSTARPPAGFVDARGWSRLVRPGENVLVLPTGGSTAAMYWQVQSGMRFRLAVPGTPFVPPRLYAQPAVIGLVDDILPEVDGVPLAAARLRAYLDSAGIGAVLVTPSARAAWTRVVAMATNEPPHRLGGSALYSVPRNPPPLRATGEVVARGVGADRVRARLRFDGRRARLVAGLGPAPPSALSSRAGDAEQVAAAAGAAGRAAVAFTEWRGGRVLLRVATHDPGGRWQVATLDDRTQPIWSLRLRMAPDGTTVVTWLDQVDPLRLVRAAARPPGGAWQRPVTLDDADGLASAVTAAGGPGTVVLAWHDSVANQERVRVATYSPAGWSRVRTVGSAVPAVEGLRFAGSFASLVEWQANGSRHVWHREESK